MNVSLYIDLRINTDTLGRIMVTRVGDDTSTDPDSVHTYRWRRARNGEFATFGTVHHRYGDGAELLAALVLRDIATTDAVEAATPKPAQIAAGRRSTSVAL